MSRAPARKGIASDNYRRGYIETFSDNIGIYGDQNPCLRCDVTDLFPLIDHLQDGDSKTRMKRYDTFLFRSAMKHSGLHSPVERVKKVASLYERNECFVGLNPEARRVPYSGNAVTADRWNRWAYLVFRDVAPVGS